MKSDNFDPAKISCPILKTKTEAENTKVWVFFKNANKWKLVGLRSDEKKFAKAMIKKGLYVQHSTPNQDMFEHWDWKVINPNKDNKETLVDTKGPSKVTRSDEKPDPEIAWLEITNVNGDIGWLKGKADYITLEIPNHLIGQKDYILVINRKKLLEWLRKKVINKEHVDSPSKKHAYRLYSRKKYGRKDVISLVFIKDIESDLKCLKIV